MEVKEVLSTIGGILFVAGFFPYARAILRKETKPARATWFIWVVLDLIIFTGMYVKGVTNCIITAAVVGGSVIFLLALKYGKGGWEKIDKWVLAGAGFGLLLWALFNSPLMGVVVSSTVMVVGSIPMFQNTWHDHSLEDKLAWTVFFIATIFGTLAVNEWTLIDASGPISYLVVQTVMMYLLFIKPKFHSS